MKFRLIAEGINQLRQFSSIKMDSKLAYRTGKALNIALSIMKDFESKHRDLIKEHGVLTEDGQNYQVPPEKAEAFSAEVEALLDQEITLPENFHGISIADLEGMSIEPSILAGIDGWFLV